MAASGGRGARLGGKAGCIGGGSQEEVEVRRVATLVREVAAAGAPMAMGLKRERATRVAGVRIREDVQAAQPRRRRGRGARRRARSADVGMHGGEGGWMRWRAVIGCGPVLGGEAREG